VLGEAIVMFRRKAEAIGGRQTFQRLLDQNGLGKIDGGEISRLEKIMANLDAVRAWHKTLPLNRQIAWSSPSSVIRNATGADGNRLFPPRQTGQTRVRTPSPLTAIVDSANGAAEQRVKELEEELANVKRHDGVSTSKNPLADFDAGQIVDFILGLKASTVRAIMHGLVKETSAPEPDGKANGSPKPPKPKANVTTPKAEPPKVRPDPLFNLINAMLEANGDQRRLIHAPIPFVGDGYALKGPEQPDGKQDIEGGLQRPDLVRIAKELGIT
jgi:hypothetical protein